MDKNLHKMDELFKAAYEQLADDPSPAVWDKINAGLDKKDAASWKRKTRSWKLTAIILLLILSGVGLYEGARRLSSPASRETNPSAVMEKKNPSNSKQKASPGIVLNTDNTVRQKANRINEDTRTNALQKKQPENNEQPARAMISPGQPKIAMTPSRVQKNNYDELSAKQDRIDQSSAISTGQSPRSVSAKKSDVTITVDRSAIRPQVIALDKNDRPIMYATVLASANPVRLNVVAGKSMKRNLSSPNARQFEGPRWELAGFFSTDRVGYHLDNDATTIARIREHEEHQPSFTVGVLVSRNISSKFSIQSGLLYSAIAIAISPQKIYASQSQGGVSYKYVTSSGYAYIKPSFASSPSPGDSINAENAQHRLAYVLVPVMLKIHLTKNKKLNFSPGVGFSGNFLTSAKIETEVEGASYREHVLINKISGNNPFNWSFRADAEINYAVNKKLLLGLRPYFSYALSPITNNNDVQTFPYTVGLGAEAIYRF